MFLGLGSITKPARPISTPRAVRRRLVRRSKTQLKRASIRAEGHFGAVSAWNPRSM